VLTEVSAARRAERSRSELVANLSHELRTPIAAARALAETLEGGVDDEARRERYERQLLAELDRLTAIVERTLHLSRIEAGAEPLELAPHQPATLLQAAAQRVAPLAEAKPVRLELLRVEAAPPVRADFDRISEVLTILLDNAVKFSPQEGRVTASAFVDPASPGLVTFEVRDQGPGVLPSERERIFERLYTGDPARADSSGERRGFGLGLAIARHIVARHGGRTWVHEVDGPGASFRFTLPVHEAAA
jgi:two-component system phosphate regulon sensor histidine kinase PhoR